MLWFCLFHFIRQPIWLASDSKFCLILCGRQFQVSSQFSRMLLHGGFPCVWPTCSPEWACPWPFRAPKGPPSSSPLSRAVPSLWHKGRLSLQSSSCPHGPSESETRRRNKEKGPFLMLFGLQEPSFLVPLARKTDIFQLPAPPASLALQRWPCPADPVPFTHDSRGGGDLPPYSPACIFLVFWLKRWNSPWFSAIVDTALLRACLRVKTGEKKKAEKLSPLLPCTACFPGSSPPAPSPALLCLSKSSSNPSTVSGCTRRHGSTAGCPPGSPAAACGGSSALDLLNHEIFHTPELRAGLLLIFHLTASPGEREPHHWVS